MYLLRGRLAGISEPLYEREREENKNDETKVCLESFDRSLSVIQLISLFLHVNSVNWHKSLHW